MPAAVQSWSTASSGSLTGSVSVTKPSGVVSGDHLLFIITTFNVQPTAVTVDGTAASRVGGLNVYLRSYIAGGSEPASYTVARTGSNGSSLAVIALRLNGVDTANPLDLGLITVQQGSVNNIILPAGTASVQGLLLTAAFKTGNISPTLTPPAGMTSVFYDDTTANSAQAVAAKTQASGSVASQTWTSGTTVQSAGVMLQIKDAITNTPLTGDVVGEGLVTSSRLTTAAKTDTATGEGAVSATLAVAYARAFTVAGEGQAQEAHQVAYARALDVTGEGTASTSRALALARETTGEGTITLTRSTVAAKTFDLTGEAAVTEAHPVQAFRTFTLDGAGTVDAAAQVPTTSLPDCPGDWPVNDGARTIAGVVRHHETGDEVDGATVRLFRDGDDLLVATTITAGGGLYAFPRDTTDPNTYWCAAAYDDGGTQVHGVSDAGRSPT